ncbi:MAG: diguanylate cyclase [Gammaproteobacteria bacterium]|nr:diguanylate cyclase [Gammaproteobacteria bacterium]
MHNIWSRLRNDAQLAIITCAGLLGLVSLSPFAFYRWVQGDLAMVVIDSLLTLFTAFALYVSWFHNKAALAGQILGVLYAIGATIVAVLLPESGLYWFYCVILFNFFIMPPLRSTIITLASLAVLCGYGWLFAGVFKDAQHLILFAATSLVCSLFAYMFAWRTTQQRRRLQQLANMDPLTGIGNRRTLMNEMEIALANYRRHGTPCGLLLLDIDHFKSINDSFGHAEGDRVLVELARLVWKSSRRTDRLFRLGGEEFVLLLPNIDMAGLTTAGQSIVLTVAGQLRSCGKQVTVSIGGALLEPGDDSISWMHRADVCLYQAKAAGRNRSIIHSPAINH